METVTRRWRLIAAAVAVTIVIVVYALQSSYQTKLCGSCAGCGVSIACKAPAGDSWTCIGGKCSRVCARTPCCGNCGTPEPGEKCEQDGTGCPPGTHCNATCTACV